MIKIQLRELGSLLEHTYLCVMKEYRPENYANVKYTLEEKEGSTLLTITQEKIGDEKAQEGNTKIWKTVLEKMKKVAENDG